MVGLDRRPTRIVAQSGAAAALWDLGVIGAVDLGAVESVGTGYGQFNVEKLTALRPDVLVSGMYLRPTCPPPPVAPGCGSSPSPRRR